MFTSIPPVLRVSSGDTITFDCLDASNGQITPASTTHSIASLVFSQLDQVNGPVYVETAEPGDTLQVEVLRVGTADWGWTACIPGFGLLANEFPEPHLMIWKLHKNEEGDIYGYAYFDESHKIKIPLRPFAGEMGVAPGEKGAFSTIPPYKTGGNIDTRHLTAGSVLYLPVAVKGALFSIGVSICTLPIIIAYVSVGTIRVECTHSSTVIYSRTVTLHKAMEVSITRCTSSLLSFYDCSAEVCGE